MMFGLATSLRVTAHLSEKSVKWRLLSYAVLRALGHDVTSRQVLELYGAVRLFWQYEAT